MMDASMSMTSSLSALFLVSSAMAFLKPSSKRLSTTAWASIYLSLHNQGLSTTLHRVNAHGTPVWVFCQFEASCRDQDDVAARVPANRCLFTHCHDMSCTTLGSRLSSHASRRQQNTSALMPTTMLSETGPIDKIESTTSWLELVCVGSFVGAVCRDLVVFSREASFRLHFV